MHKRSGRFKLKRGGPGAVASAPRQPATPSGRPRREQAALLKGTVVVPCAFCRGVGRDEYGLRSRLGTCQVCGGRGWRRLPPPVARCAFCRGTGVHPGSRLTCTACGGLGTVPAPSPAVTCPLCGGSGHADNASDFSPDSPLYCLRCSGKGLIPAEYGQSV